MASWLKVLIIVTVVCVVIPLLAFGTCMALLSGWGS